MRNAYLRSSCLILKSTVNHLSCLFANNKSSLITSAIVNKPLLAHNTYISLSRYYGSSTSKSPNDPTVDKVNTKVVPKIKTSFSYDDSVKSIKYITPLRALREYMLTKQDLDQLPRYYSRSPYGNETKTLVFLRSDVEQMAYSKHGGHDVFELRRKLMKDMERRTRADLFNMKRALKYLRSAVESTTAGTSIFMDRRKRMFKSGPGRVVLFAIAV
ncbi:unnamed protein product [Heterobilharzia americana]|nr:unnamed protein product [Heterobilharzia americana]